MAFASVQINIVQVAVESGIGGNTSLMASSNEAKTKMKMALKRLELQVALADDA